MSAGAWPAYMHAQLCSAPVCCRTTMAVKSAYSPGEHPSAIPKQLLLGVVLGRINEMLFKSSFCHVLRHTMVLRR